MRPTTTHAFTPSNTSPAVFGAASESFSMKNINCSVDESLLRFSEVLQRPTPVSSRPG